MIRHVTLVKFEESFTPDLVATWSAGLDALAAIIPGLLRLTHGRDILPDAQPGIATRADYAIVIDAESVEAVRAYLTHPDHIALTKISVPNSSIIISADLESA